MGRIRVLPEHIANKIAAGEVVDRPASIVKELVENALDAAASRIEVRIQHGGKSLIRVADNGHGMMPEDAVLAFERHATSKIASAEDLWTVASFGFRGEALPSIAAVSRTRLTTGTNDRDPAAEVQLDGGIGSAPQPAAPLRGTSVEVKDLFFNTPARRKFLKSDQTEAAHCAEAVFQLALAHPEVHFVFISGNSTLIDARPARNLRERASSLYGEDAAKQLIDFAHDGAGIRLQGLLGKPSLARATRAGQSFFVNRRWVRAPALSYTLQEAFSGLLMHARFPSAFIFIDVDTREVDVNVHPTKQQVKLSNEQDVKAQLLSGVRLRLRREPDMAPHWAPRPEPVAMRPAWPSARVTAQASSSGGPSAGGSSTAGPNEALFSVQEARVPYAVSPAASAPPVSLRNKLRFVRVLGQAHGTYIVAETDDGFAMVDQHAAHERVVFEELLAQLRSGKPERQVLLHEAVLELSPGQRALLDESRPLLRRLGMETEAFGERSVVIRSLPTVLRHADPASFLRDFLDKKEEGIETGEDRELSEIAALIACKRKSVKANEALAPQAVASLLERLARCENPFNCPHGRPTLILQTLQELERQFRRT